MDIVETLTDDLIDVFEGNDIAYNSSVVGALAGIIESMVETGLLSNPEPDLGSAIDIVVNVPKWYAEENPDIDFSEHWNISVSR